MSSFYGYFYITSFVLFESHFTTFYLFFQMVSFRFHKLIKVGLKSSSYFCC